MAVPGLQPRSPPPRACGGKTPCQSDCLRADASRASQIRFVHKAHSAKNQGAERRTPERHHAARWARGKGAERSPPYNIPPPLIESPPQSEPTPEKPKGQPSLVEGRRKKSKAHEQGEYSKKNMISRR